jgi:hypothetical protein
MSMYSKYLIAQVNISFFIGNFFGVHGVSNGCRA